MKKKKNEEKKLTNLRRSECDHLTITNHTVQKSQPQTHKNRPICRQNTPIIVGVDRERDQVGKLTARGGSETILSVSVPQRSFN